MLSFPTQSHKKNIFRLARYTWKKQTQVLANQHIFKSGLILYKTDLSYFLKLFLTNASFLVISSSFSSSSKTLSSLWYCFLQCQFAFPTYYLMVNIQIFWLWQLFLTNLVSGKTSSLVKNLYILTLPDDEAETLAVCLSKLYWAFFYSILLWIILIFSLTAIL